MLLQCRNMKEIDYLFEDPPINGQKYALVSIVGPHMPQKCNVWGLKIRGVADTLEKAKSNTQKLIKIDNSYDIYTVEVGKFFPLNVDPHDVGNVEYQNDQLNKMIKQYLENREQANEHWHERKNQMIQEAIKEGRNQQELANRPEHPVVVLQRIRTHESSINELTEKLEETKELLKLAQEKYSKCTEEEKEQAQKELDASLKEISEENDSNKQSLDDIRKELSTLQPQRAETSEIDKTLDKIKSLEEELDELHNIKNTLMSSSSKHLLPRTLESIQNVENEINNLKSNLNNQNLVNDFINKNYSTSPIQHLM